MSTQLAPRSEAAADRNERRTDVVYAVMREGLSSVFSSQVLDRIPNIRRDAEVQLLVFVPIGHFLRQRWRQEMGHLRRLATEKYDVELNSLLSPPARLRWLWNDAWTLRLWLHKNYGSQRVVVHCRNAEMTDTALQARRSMPNVAVVFDCRGAEGDELIGTSGRHMSSPEHWPRNLRTRYEAAENREQHAVESSDAIFCVSHAMAAHLASKYSVSVDRFAVIPCCVDSKPFQEHLPRREDIRRHLGLHEKFVVTYCGSMAWYQMPDASLRVFRLLKGIAPHAHFLALTTQPQVMKEAVLRAEIAESDVTILSVRPEQVPRHLVASDVGLLLREPTLVNRVASPVKFGEYMASGTPVILTEGIGDFSAAVRTHGLGVVIDLSQDDEGLRLLLREAIHTKALSENRIRDRCSEYAATYLAWRCYLTQASDVYNRWNTGSESMLGTIRAESKR